MENFRKDKLTQEQIDSLDFSLDIDTYFKNIGILKKAVDYDAVVNAGFPINIIQCERTLRVKTYGLKAWTYKKWQESGAQVCNTLWMRNLSDDIKLEKMKFLKDTPDEMKNLKLGKGDTIVDQKNNEYLVFAPVGTTRSLRGSKQWIEFACIDEFNDSFERLKNSYLDALLSLLVSSDKALEDYAFNKRKLFLLGNNRTINHPIFVELGISYLYQEVTPIYDDNGNKLALIINPILSDEEIAELDKTKQNDWVYQLAKKTGRAGHIYYNQNQYDSNASIYPQFNDQHNQPGKRESVLQTLKMLNFTWVFRVFENYYGIFDMPKWMSNEIESRFHVVNLTLLENQYGFEFPNKDRVLVSNERFQNEGEMLIHASRLPKLRELFAQNKISFENVSSRSGFIDFINKLGAKKRV